MPLFGEEPRQIQLLETFTQPRWLWPKADDSRWLAATKRRLNKVYFPIARLGRRASRVGKRLFRWRKPLVLVVASLLVFFIVVSIGSVGYRIWRIPRWVVEGALTSDQLITRVTAYRSSSTTLLSVLIQSLAGIALLIGLYFTWRQIVAGQEAQVSGRFTTAMNQLASDRIDVRVGGIHGLERISIGREPELESALMVLTAFVLQRSREHDSATTAGVLPLDLQIALAVLVRFQRSRPKSPAAKVSLRGISLAHARLSDIDFSSFDLHGADCRAAALDGARFYGADLTDTNFEGADLRFADFSGAWLVHTNFRGANLSDALFRRVAATHLNLCESILMGTDFEWSQISADLRGAILEDTMFYGATFSYSNVSGVDLRKTRGLPDLYVTGAGVKTEGTIMPGKSLADVNSNPAESSGRPQFWRPPDGQRISLRGSGSMTSYSK